MDPGFGPVVGRRRPSATRSGARCPVDAEAFGFGLDGEAEGLEEVEADHEEIAELGKRLRRDIEAVIAGEEMTSERVVEDAKAYMHRLDRHMTWEEEDLFRRADAEIDRLEIDASHLSAIDPVFGEKREASFENLAQTIDGGAA